MNPSVPDTLLKIADVLHFLGHYRGSNLLTLLSRWLRARGIETDDRLEFAVLAAEQDAHRSASTARSYEAATADLDPLEDLKRSAGPDAYHESTETPERK